MIRENRYLVIKIKDLEKLKQKVDIHYELGYMEDILAMLPHRHYVVVEDDWPEYEVVWKMIEDRVNRETS